MKGIILAGGSGSRLYPVTKIYSKQLVAVYDKPMIYYPLTTLINAGIDDILVIADNAALTHYRKLFANVASLNLHIQYAEQAHPNGIAEAFIIGEQFIRNDNVVLILGDNIFYGCDDTFTRKNDKPHIYCLAVKQPEKYGVVKFVDSKPSEIIEKPKTFISNYAVPGIYHYDANVVEIAKSLKPSARGELEITDINNIYLKANKLDVIQLGENVEWFDSGTPQSLLDASNFIASIEEHDKVKIGCFEEALISKGICSKVELKRYADQLPASQYRAYLEKECL
jgi:glucose-1-phosphate thymidylyltransferase